MRYLDSNVFAYASLYEGPKSSAARGVLEAMVSGAEPGATASPTLDEVVRIVSERAARDVALEQGHRLLGFPNLSILDVTARTMGRALRHLDAHPHLTPRDAVHLAEMTEHGIYTVVSDDADFDSVGDIDRLALDAVDEGGRS